MVYLKINGPEAWTNGNMKVGVVIKLKKNQAVSMIIPKKYHFQKFWKYMLFWLISL